MLGTPTEENWPGISMSEELQNYNFPPYPAEPLVKRAPRLDAEGIDLVSKFLLYEARKRVSAKEGMHHSYFASLGPGVNNLLDGKEFLCFFLLNIKAVGCYKNTGEAYILGLAERDLWGLGAESWFANHNICSA